MLKGSKMSEVQKKRLSKSHRESLVVQAALATLHAMNSGRKVSAQTKAKLRGRIPWNKGVPCVEATKRKISVSVKRLWGNSEYNERMRKAHTGHRVLKSTKARMSKIMSGSNNPFFGRHHSKDSLKKMRDAHVGVSMPVSTRRKHGYRWLGSKNPRWKGGIYEKSRGLNLTIRQLFEYNQWRREVFTRDGFTCQECGVRGGKLHAHHIIPFKKIINDNEITTAGQALACSELWDVNNGMTLHFKCHRIVHQRSIECQTN